LYFSPAPSSFNYPFGFCGFWMHNLHSTPMVPVPHCDNLFICRHFFTIFVCLFVKAAHACAPFNFFRPLHHLFAFAFNLFTSHRGSCWVESFAALQKKIRQKIWISYWDSSNELNIFQFQERLVFPFELKWDGILYFYFLRYLCI